MKKIKLNRFRHKADEELLNEEYERFKYEVGSMKMADISPNTQVGIRETVALAPWFARYLLYIALACIVIFLTGIVGALMPYEPYHFYGWTSVPQKACPLNPIHVEYASSLTKGIYTVNSIRGTATLDNAETRRPVDAWPIEDDSPQYHGYEVQPSYVERVAPSIPGEYNLGFHITVRGNMFGVVPTHQEVDATSEEVITVLNPDDPSCQEN